MFRIFIADKNDHSPEFQYQSYSADVPENSDVNSVVMEVHAYDIDSGRHLDDNFTNIYIYICNRYLILNKINLPQITLVLSLLTSRLRFFFSKLVGFFLRIRHYRKFLFLNYSIYHNIQYSLWK